MQEVQSVRRLTKGLIAFIVLVSASEGCAGNPSSNVGSKPTAGHAAAAKPPVRHAAVAKPKVVAYHGYALSSKTDFWDTDASMCLGTRRVAENVVNGEPADVEDLPGHSTIEQGTRVEIIGHKSGYCDGSDVEISMTQVEVEDGNSAVNGETGYIMEGLLTKE